MGLKQAFSFIVLSIVFMTPALVSAQTYFGNVYDSDYYNKYVDIDVHDKDGGRILVGSSGPEGDIITYLEENGDIRWSGLHMGTDELVALTPVEGGWVVAGNVSDGIVLFKVDEYGTINWQQRYKGMDGKIYVTDIVSDQEDNIYVTGRITLPPSGSTTVYNSDVWIMKTDSAGILQWSQSYYHNWTAPSNPHNEIGISLALGSADSDILMVAANFRNSNSPKRGIWILQLDKICGDRRGGTIFWPPAMDDAYAAEIKYVTEETFVLTGAYNYNGDSETLVVKFTSIPSLIPIWSKIYGYIYANWNEYGYSLIYRSGFNDLVVVGTAYDYTYYKSLGSILLLNQDGIVNDVIRYGDVENDNFLAVAEGIDPATGDFSVTGATLSWTSRMEGWVMHLPSWGFHPTVDCIKRSKTVAVHGVDWIRYPYCTGDKAVEVERVDEYTVLEEIEMSPIAVCP